MAILFDNIVFGPVNSRRFGKSLGINLLPLDNKVCNFNCIYCECGWTDLNKEKIIYLPTEVIIKSITEQFKNLSCIEHKIDSITFAGNGEPTMHPEFLQIIQFVIKLRDTYLPNVKIVVLSNGALMGNKKVMEALLLVDLPVLKLDAGSDNLFRKINLPLANRDINWYCEKLQSFNGKVTIQTIFFKGIYEKTYIDNTTLEEVNLWIKLLKKINPKEVMIYTIDRSTPAKNLEKISLERLNEICAMVNNEGIKATVYY